jgi:hypothetical protein
LLGRRVDVSGESGNESGTVSALNFVNSEPRLTVTLANGSILTDVSLSRLVSVR